MQIPVDRDPRLRPWWHVGVPFWIGAGMVGAIGVAGRNPLALLLTVVFAAWGLVWGLRARRGARQHAQLIAAATDLLTDPTPEHAVWLGPATLLLRPRRPGHLLWTTEGLAWTTTEVSGLADRTRRVMLGAVTKDLSLPFSTLTNLEHETKMLSGDRLILDSLDGDTCRFRLADPATYSFVIHAFQSRQRG